MVYFHVRVIPNTFLLDLCSYIRPLLDSIIYFFVSDPCQNVKKFYHVFGLSAKSEVTQKRYEKRSVIAMVFRLAIDRVINFLNRKIH